MFLVTKLVSENSKSFVPYIYFNGAPTSPFVACFSNNIECEPEAIIAK